MRTVDRILAISDIHGENKKLLSLLKKSEYHPEKDLLVVCGDIIDRGTENLETIHTCIALQKQGAIILKGNHEQFAEECLRDMFIADDWDSPSIAIHTWITHNGGSKFYNEIKNFPKEKIKYLLKFFRSLPLYFTVGDYIFTHAAANTKKTIEENTASETVWAEDNFYYRPAYKNKIMVFGHTPTWLLRPYSKKNKPENAKIWFDPTFKDKIGIDCGSVFGGRLALLELPSGREFYV